MKLIGRFTESEEREHDKASALPTDGERQLAFARIADKIRKRLKVTLLTIMSEEVGRAMVKRRPYFEAIATLSFLSEFENFFGGGYVHSQRLHCMRIIAREIAEHPDLVTFQRALTYPDPKCERFGCGAKMVALPIIDEKRNLFFECTECGTLTEIIPFRERLSFVGWQRLRKPLPATAPPAWFLTNLEAIEGRVVAALDPSNVSWRGPAHKLGWNVSSDPGFPGGDVTVRGGHIQIKSVDCTGIDP